MQLLTPLDPTLARETYLHALEAAIITGGPAAACGRWPRPPAPAPAPSESPQPADLLLDGLVTIFTRRYEAGVPGLRSALDAFCSEGQPADAGRRSDSHRWLWHATRAAASLFDDEMIYELATRNVRLARETGALATLPSALISLSITQALTGELAHAAELAAEETAIRVATGAVPLRHHVQLIQTAWRGLSDETVEIHAAIVREAAGRWRGTEVSLAQYALAVLHNGLGDFQRRGRLRRWPSSPRS